MTWTSLWHNGSWSVGIPGRRLTTGHLVLVGQHPGQDTNEATAADFLDAYRRARSALWFVVGSRGFASSFALGWRPAADRIGEPDPISTDDQVLHVFGRASSDPLSPVRAMAIAASDREYVGGTDDQLEALAAALAEGRPVDVPGPSDDDCDGCAASVLTDQERWRADGVRVIRPRHVMIDSQVLVLPLRHVISVGDLTAAEVVSISGRLDEARRQFAAASGVTGLSCFVNDGTSTDCTKPPSDLRSLLTVRTSRG